MIKKVYRFLGIIGIAVAILLFITGGGVLTLTQFCLSIVAGIIFGIGV